MIRCRLLKSGPKLYGTLPAFEGAPSLVSLYLDYNNIAGSVPDNFLKISNKYVEATFKNNLLTGSMPAKLFMEREKGITIELEGNKISQMDGAFYSAFKWMDDNVAKYGYNAILYCPGFANTNGRLNDKTDICVPCPIKGSAKYYGSTTCEAVYDDETFILKELYIDCNGKKWKNQDNWMSSANICTWYGITCDDLGHVTNIQLEENNLMFTPPKQLFQLRFLRELILHGNEIHFSFESIELARELTILHLGNTELYSLAGLSDASSLQRIHLSGNNLAGPFPPEILYLSNIKSIDLENNSLEGSLPDFGKLEYLTKLNLANNKFSGGVPSFKDNWRCEYN